MFVVHRATLHETTRTCYTIATVPIYLDNNGSTPLDPRVRDVICQELESGPSNPSSIHSCGRFAKARLIRAHQRVADYFGVHPDEIVFTSSGTEALNLAIKGITSKGVILSTRIEHAAVFNTLRQLDRPIRYLSIGRLGHIDLRELKEAITSDVGMIVLSAANSETGVKNPLEEIAAIAHHYHIPLVVDGVALLGKEVFTIPQGVMAMAFSGHKIHGPTGVGCLFLKRGTPVSPLLTGGGQEAGRRAGTENLAAIVGFAKAIELLDSELPQATARIGRLRDALEKGLSGGSIVGTGPRVCNTSCLTFSGTDGEGLLIQLDMAGICASMGSACSAGAIEPSRVLLEMGLDHEEARSTLRFSLSRLTTAGEIKTLCAQQLFLAQ